MIRYRLADEEAENSSALGVRSRIDVARYCRGCLATAQSPPRTTASAASKPGIRYRRAARRNSIRSIGASRTNAAQKVSTGGGRWFRHVQVGVRVVEASPPPLRPCDDHPEQVDAAGGDGSQHRLHLVEVASPGADDQEGRLTARQVEKRLRRSWERWGVEDHDAVG